MVAAGYEYSLGLLNNGTVVGWGYSTSPTEDGCGWVPTNLVNNVTMIAAGWDHNVALLTNGTVIAWGDNTFGEINVPSNLTNVTVISAQALHTLALCNNGTVVAWGDEDYGQCDVPSGLTNVTAIAAGGEHSLAVSNGFVVAWGYDLYNQCNVPAGLSNVVNVAASGYHSLALLQNGTVVAWGDDDYGEIDVPAGLSNVVAIAAGGDSILNYTGETRPYSLALKSDGTVVAWGAGDVLDSVEGLSNVISISGGVYYALAVRTGPATPVITLEPTDEYQVVGGNATFTARGAGLYGVTYLWQTNGVNLSGATNATLTLTNVQAVQLGVNYDVVVTDNTGMGSIVSSNANLYLVTPPVINSEILPTYLCVFSNSNTRLTLGVSASAPWQSNGFPLSYQWQFNGANIPLHTSSNCTFTAVNSGTYSLIVSNAAGSVTVVWQVNVVYPGGVMSWGDDSYGQCDTPLGLTNAAVIAAGEYHSVAVKDNGSVVQWGYDWADVPANLTNAVAVAAGYNHSIAVRNDGTVVTWGYSNSPANVVPANLSGVKAVAVGWKHNVALLTNGTVMAWGDNSEGQTDIPAGLTNVTAISACYYHNMALNSDGTVVAWGNYFEIVEPADDGMVVGWGDDFGENIAPAGLSNVVAIAAGFEHDLALKADGTVVAWGANAYGQTNVPPGLSNVMAIAVGYSHSVALKNDGTVVCWGDNTFGQTNVPAMSQVKSIAAGGNHTLAGIFSPLVQYPVDVTKDLLLIYNSNSADSSNLCAYYLAHHPMVSNANVLGVACDVGEFFTNTNDWDTQLVDPVLNWLTNNPTKHPQYVILFYDIPTRLWLPDEYGCGEPEYDGSVSYHLQSSYPGWKPFVNNINAGTFTDCKAYVDKIASFGTNLPGQLVISASAGRYGNTNYYFDDSRDPNYAGPPSLGNNGAIGVIGSDPLASVTYTNGNDHFTNRSIHLLSGTNVSGYLCWGAHSALGGTYPIDGTVKWTGNSGWWIIETVESFNGMRGGCGQGNFIQWFSSNAFGGTNYSNTPIGAVSHTEEPGLLYVENSSIYFGLWAGGKNFAICAWNSRITLFFQAVGDPFVVK